jgi:creatinine amidohydrolase
VRVRFHNWWNAPRTWAKVQEIDPVASHASWMENFPWTRLADIALPDTQKPMTDVDWLRQLSAAEVRAQLGDGNYGGRYQRSDAEMQAIWQVAVAETRALIAGPWPVDTA